MDQYPSYEEIQKLREQLSHASYDHWVHDDFLTWKWWLLLALSIVPWFIWVKIVDKQRAHEILLYGVFIGICSITLDNIGTELIWWGYPVKLLQMVPPLLPADLTLVPTSMMVIYQCFPRWKSFVIASIVFGAFLAYVAETIFVWLDYYRLNSWKPFYSLIFYIITALLGRLIVMVTLSKAKKGTPK